MRRKAEIGLVAITLALGGLACGEKDEPEAGTGPETTVEPATTVAPTTTTVPQKQP